MLMKTMKDIKFSTWLLGEIKTPWKLKDPKRQNSAFNSFVKFWKVKE